MEQQYYNEKLLKFPGITKSIADIIIIHYPSPMDLYNAFQLYTEENKYKLLSAIRGISPTKAKQIITYFTFTEESFRNTFILQ